jgi:hypothetical protein
MSETTPGMTWCQQLIHERSSATPTLSPPYFMTAGTGPDCSLVLANTGSVLSVQNSGYAGNSTGTVAAGSPISLCAPPSSGSDLIYGRDDFLSFDTPTDGAATWSYVGTNGPSTSNCQNGHAGIVSFPSGTTQSVNELVANQGSDLGGPVFANVQKCLVRWVVLCNGLYSSSSFDGEWYVGLGNPDGSGAMYGGALLSFAPGFPAIGLLAGSYTGISSNIGDRCPRVYHAKPLIKGGEFAQERLDFAFSKIFKRIFSKTNSPGSTNPNCGRIFGFG